MSSLVRVVLVVALVASTTLVASGRSEAVYVPETLAHRAPVGVQPVDTPFTIDHIGVLWDLERGHEHDHGHGDGRDRVAAHNIDGLEPNGAVRFLDADGRWGPWIRLLEDGAEGPGQWASGLISADGAVGYQLRGVPPEAVAPRAVAINVTDGPPVAVADRPAGAADASTETKCLSRAQWGADETLRRDAAGDEIWPPAFYPVQGLVVHHTATTNDDPDPAGRVRAIYRYHAVDRGWGDIGYHYLIDEAGSVYEGRWSGTASTGCEDIAHNSEEGSADELVTAAHTGGANSGNVGVALLGEFTDHPRFGATPTDAAVGTLEDVLAGLAVRHGLDPTGVGRYVNPVNDDSKDGVDTISSHRDWTSTECPGERLYDLLPQIRQNVAAKAGDVVVEEPALTVTITSPVGESTVSGTVSIMADASDHTVVEQVEFLVDGAWVGTDTEGANGWSIDWDSTTVEAGERVLSATATDTAGQTATASITVTVDNVDAPPAELIVQSVTPNAVVPGDTTLTITGTGFDQDASVLFEGGKGPAPDIGVVDVWTPNELGVTISVRSGGPSSSWDIRVTSGGSSAVLPGGLTVTR